MGHDRDDMQFAEAAEANADETASNESGPSAEHGCLVGEVPALKTREDVNVRKPNDWKGSTCV
jgi:hypothetical protein